NHGRGEKGPENHPYGTSFGGLYDAQGNPLAHFRRDGPEPSIRATVSVKSEHPNSYGLHHMTGNVWEWTSGLREVEIEREDIILIFMILCGGSYDKNDEDFLRAAYRIRRPPGVPLVDEFGFRLVVAPPLLSR
ncbi:MAG TPA: hypothetical protein DF383_13180, partial [Deltaproteobacteria bacterium]|nr:hypothetical protein [Deltaproteobacteria bacterium]